MSFSGWFGFGSASASDEIPDIFPLGVSQKDFITIDVQSIYAKILTDVAERSEGLSEDDEAVLWDSCLASNSALGLITRVSRAMVDKSELFLVLDKATKVLRLATADEQRQIITDYKTSAESSVGTFINFSKYTKTDMVKLYSALEFCNVASLNKSMNLSKSIQIKISDLRASVSLTDSAEAKLQATKIANALKNGRDTYMDAKDEVVTGKPDLTATTASMELVNQKRAFYLGLPCSYITGELNSGLGDTGQADARAIERGLRSYFESIFKPICKSLFGKTLTFGSDDFQQIETSMEVFKTFELTGEELLTSENKRIILNKLLGLDPDTAGGKPDPVVTPPASSIVS